MEMKVNVENMEKIVVTFEGLPKKINNNVVDELVIAGSELMNEMIDSMTDSPPIGFKYKRGGKEHIASAPGYPPRRDSGQLQNSFLVDVDESNGTVEVGSTVTDPPYPKWLEEGIDWWSREGNVNLLPRPFMQPAIKKITPAIESRVMDAIRDSIE